jgi:hypothetical protein
MCAVMLASCEHHPGRSRTASADASADGTCEYIHIVCTDRIRYVAAADAVADG